MRKFLSTILLICLSIVSYAQQADSTINLADNDEVVIIKPDNSAPLKIGLKLGVGYSDFMGSEFAHSVGRIGVNGSAYIRYRFKTKWSFQTEVGASFRGSNFSNTSSEYSSIRMYYIDIPVMLAYAFDKTNNDLIIAGFQYSYLLNSTLYISDAALPEANSPSFKTSDIPLILGVQFNTPFVGFQILSKYGLANLNQNQQWPSNAKPANSFGTIHNFSIEFNLLF